MSEFYILNIFFFLRLRFRGGPQKEKQDLLGIYQVIFGMPKSFLGAKTFFYMSGEGE